MRLKPGEVALAINGSLTYVTELARARFALAVAELLQQRGMTQRKLAAVVGVTHFSDSVGGCQSEPYDLEQDRLCSRLRARNQAHGASVKIIFLDIDGVLNHNNVPRMFVAPTATEPVGLPVDPDCMARLNRLIAATDARVVLSTSWRLYFPWRTLAAALQRAGLVGEVVGQTPDLVNESAWLEAWAKREGKPFPYDRMTRGTEIAEWMKINAQVTSFVILDDVSDMAYLHPRLVLVNPAVGLSDLDVELATWLMNS